MDKYDHIEMECINGKQMQYKNNFQTRTISLLWMERANIFVIKDTISSNKLIKTTKYK